MAATFSHWRRLIKHIGADCIDKISPSVLIRLFIFRKRGHLASLLQWEKVARFTATDEVLLQYIAKITLSRYVRTQTRTQTPTARFAIA